MLSEVESPETELSDEQRTEPFRTKSLDGKALTRKGAIRHRRMVSVNVGRPLSAPQPLLKKSPSSRPTSSPIAISSSMPTEGVSCQHSIEQKSMSQDNIKPLVRRGAIRHKRVTKTVVRRPFSAPQTPIFSTSGRLKISPLRAHPSQSIHTNVSAEATAGQESCWSPFDHFLQSYSKLFSFKAKDIAAELTLIDAEMFRCIAPSELKDAAWTKTETKVRKIQTSYTYKHLRHACISLRLQ